MLSWLSKEFLVAIIGSLTIALIALSLGGLPHDSGSENSRSNENIANQKLVFQIECNPNCTLKHTNNIGDDNGFTGLYHKLIDDPVISLAGGTLIANFLLVLAVWNQIREARQSNEARLRAYVVAMVGTHFRQGATKGLRFEFRPVMLNTGQTPAYEVRTIARVKFMSPAEASTFNLTLADPVKAGTAISAVTLGPRQDRFVQTVSDFSNDRM